MTCDAGRSRGLAAVAKSKKDKKTTKRQRVYSGGYHKVLAGWTVIVDRTIGLCPAGGAVDRLRLRPRSASAAVQHVFRRSVGRLGQFQGPCFRAVARQHVRTGLRRRRRPTAGIRRKR